MQPKGGFDPNILAFDTSLPQISAALSSDVIIAEHDEQMARGQAEKLMPVLENLLREAGGDWSNLDLIAVGVGPGNFTGIRISVSAARGLALGLGIPAIGVSMFEALLDWDGPLYQPAEILSIAAPRGQAYVQYFRYGMPQAKPRLIDPCQPPLDLQLPVNMIVRGHCAEQIARPFNARWEEVAPNRVAANIARIAEIRWRDPGYDAYARPTPLYIRAPDAAPSRHTVPTLAG